MVCISYMHMSYVPNVAMIYHVFSYELCVADDFFQEPQIRFHRNMESLHVLYIMFTIMFKVTFVCFFAFLCLCKTQLIHFCTQYSTIWLY